MVNILQLKNKHDTKHSTYIIIDSIYIANNICIEESLRFFFFCLQRLT